MKYRLLILYCSFFVVLGVMAQNKKKKVVKKPVVASAQNNRVTSLQLDGEKALVSEDVMSLFNAYQFEEASEQLQKEIDFAQKKKYDTSLQEQFMQKIRVGENMIQATAKVVFIDSIVVDKKSFLSSFKLSKGCGTVVTFSEAFPDTQEKSSEVRNSTVYINEFSDQIVYSSFSKQGLLHLFTSNKIGEGWSTPKELTELTEEGANQGYPYIMSDGITLYYASQAEGSLGGYDIYVTRYNTDTKKYVKPENLGMPFNSPANDYLYLIDETNGLGWFVSDRYQPEGKVCIYIFIPTESRQSYNMSAENGETVRNLARISGIKRSQTNKKEVESALKRLREIQDAKVSLSQNSDFRFVVSNGLVYNSTSQFKSAKAKDMAANWSNTLMQRNNVIEQLKQNRSEYGKGNKNLKSEILKQEQQLEQLDAAIATLENDIRKEEQNSLGIK